MTEFSHGGQSAGDRRETARYLVQMGTALLAAGVDHLYWYLLRDYREFQGNGLVREPESELGRYAPAPAYAAYANLIHQLGEARFVRLDAGDARAPVYLFAHHGQEVRVAWASDPPATLQFNSDERLSILDVVGRQTMTLAKGSAGTLVLDNSPVYIVGNVRRITAVGRGKLLADSVGDYSDQQGQAGWSYGYDDGQGAGNGPYAVDGVKLLVPVTDEWRRHWGEPRHPWLAIGAHDAHPSASAGRPIWAVRRWTSPASGPVCIRGQIIHAAPHGDGVTVHIAVDGQFVLSANLRRRIGHQKDRI